VTERRRRSTVRNKPEVTANMANALVNLGPGAAIVSGLNRCEQLFLARWLQLLHDETHPRWSARPLSKANLSSLYQHNLVPRNKQVLFLIEDELLRRLAASEPDVDDITHPAAKPKANAELLYCATCGVAGSRLLVCDCSRHHCLTAGPHSPSKKCHTLMIMNTEVSAHDVGLRC
jgi:hypothetical protein